MTFRATDFIHKDDPLQVRELSESTRRFAASELQIGENEEPTFRRSDFQKMAKLGLTGASITESHGGTGLEPFEIATIIFEISRVQLGPAVFLSVHQMVSRLIETWGKGEYFERELPLLANGTSLGAFCLTESQAGSDAAALRTQAVKSGSNYVLSGEKIYITSGGVADRYLVFARTSTDQRNGISAFLISKETPGISFGKPEKKMGCEGAPICSVTFENCSVPESALLGSEGEGYKIALSGLRGGRVNIAAGACGIAANALEIATAHAKERKQFGQAIAEFQGIQFLLADMAAKLRASVLLTRDAAMSLGADPQDRLSASIAKCFATDAAMEITTDAVQILGGAGYLRDYTVERLMRDAKMLQIVEGTNQIQRALIARDLLE